MNVGTVIAFDSYRFCHMGPLITSALREDDMNDNITPLHFEVTLPTSETYLGAAPGVYILEKTPPGGEKISADVIWGKKYEKAKRKKGKM